MRRGRTLLQLSTGLALAGLAMWLTYRRVPPGELLDLLEGARWGWLPVVLLPLAASYAFRILRWTVLLRPIRAVSFLDASSPLLAGFMVNSILPARAGEIVRVLLLSRRTGLPKASVLGTVVLDRIFDGLTLTAMTLGCIAGLWSGLGTGVRLGLVAASAMYVFMLLFALALHRWRGAAARAAARPLARAGLRRPAAKLESLLLSFSDGLATIRSGREVLFLALTSAGVWGSLVVSIYPVFAALELPLAWHYPVIVLVLAAFGMLVPTPAGTGTVHAALAAALPAVTELTTEQAMVLALLFHATQFLPVIAAGIAAAVHEGVRPLEVADES